MRAREKPTITRCVCAGASSWDHPENDKPLELAMGVQDVCAAPYLELVRPSLLIPKAVDALLNCTRLGIDVNC